MTDLVSLSTFTPHLGDVFHVAIENDVGYPLTLFEATELPAQPHPNRQRDPFQLKFRGPGPRYLVQRTHELRHPQLGIVAMFLVPVGQEESDFIYQAVYT